jgi:hypothetical protein
MTHIRDLYSDTDLDGTNRTVKHLCCHSYVPPNSTIQARDASNAFPIIMCSPHFDIPGVTERSNTAVSLITDGGDLPGESLNKMYPAGSFAGVTFQDVDIGQWENLTGQDLKEDFPYSCVNPSSGRVFPLSACLST